MTIRLYKDTVSMLNPPNEGVIKDMDGNAWNIGRNGNGLIVLRQNGEVHPEFVDGMDLQGFCWWINEHTL